MCIVATIRVSATVSIKRVCCYTSTSNSARDTRTLYLKSIRLRTSYRELAFIRMADFRHLMSEHITITCTVGRNPIKTNAWSRS